MKRKLVIYNEAKRHWLRQQLPAAALRVDPENMVATGSARDDIKLFLATYVAAFVAVSIFIF
jgi:hypothetical protein